MLVTANLSTMTGIAYVNFEAMKEAESAMKALNGKIIGMNALKIQFYDKENTFLTGMAGHHVSAAESPVINEM